MVYFRIETKYNPECREFLLSTITIKYLSLLRHIKRKPGGSFLLVSSFYIAHECRKSKIKRERENKRNRKRT